MKEDDNKIKLVVKFATLVPVDTIYANISPIPINKWAFSLKNKLTAFFRSLFFLLLYNFRSSCVAVLSSFYKNSWMVIQWSVDQWWLIGYIKCWKVINRQIREFCGNFGVHKNIKSAWMIFYNECFVLYAHKITFCKSFLSFP